MSLSGLVSQLWPQKAYGVKRPGADLVQCLGCCLDAHGGMVGCCCSTIIGEGVLLCQAPSQTCAAHHKWSHFSAACAATAADADAAACRPEADFSSLEALVTRIHKDGDVSREALSQPELQRFASDSFLQPSECLQQQVQPQAVAGTDAAAGADVDAADELVAVAASG